VAKPASGTPLDTSHAFYPYWAACWGFLEANTPTTSADSFGTRTLTLSGSGLWASDSDGPYIHITAASNTNLVPASSLTLSANTSWSILFRGKQTTSGTAGMLCGNTGTNSTNFLFFNGPTTLRFRDSGANNRDSTITSTTTLADYAVTYTATGAGFGNLKVYENGTLKNTITGIPGPLVIAALAAGSSAGLGLAGDLRYVYVLNGLDVSQSQAASISASPYQVFGTAALTAGTASVTGIASGQVTLSAAAASGGTSPYSYQWQQSATGGGAGFSDIAGATSLAPTVTGLTDGTLYYFRLKVTDSAGSPATAYSNEVSATPGNGTVTPTQPVAYQTFQRDSAGYADIPVAGSYLGTPTTLEASFAGRSYLTAVSAPAGGAYSAKVKRQATGAGDCVVRFSNSTGVTGTATPVLVGDVWVVYGQSNATGRGTNDQSFTGPSGYGSKLYTSNVPALLADPTGIDSNGTPAGSAWPLLGTLIANAGVPVQFVARGAGGTSIAALLSGSTPYTTMRTAARAVTTAPRGVIYWQGETDAAAGMDAATYYANLASLAASVYADLGCCLWVVRLQACTDGAAAAGLAAIHAAQDRAAAECPYVVQVCDLSDLATDDGFHLQSDTKLQTAATRMFAGMQNMGLYAAVQSGGFILGG
jgi:hypothetical protein